MRCPCQCFINHSNIFTLLTYQHFFFAFGRYYKDSFSTYSWQHGQEILFTPTIEDISKSYALALGVRHLYGFPLDKITVTIKTISPSGKETTKDYELAVKDSQNNYISKCAGDICDLETTVETNITYEEPGKYKYLVSHTVQVNKIPGVMELGLIIDEKD